MGRFLIQFSCLSVGRWFSHSVLKKGLGSNTPMLLPELLFLSPRFQSSFLSLTCALTCSLVSARYSLPSSSTNSLRCKTDLEKHTDANHELQVLRACREVEGKAPFVVKHLVSTSFTCKLASSPQRSPVCRIFCSNSFLKGIQTHCFFLYRH